MTQIKNLIEKHSAIARKSMQGEAGSRTARFNAFIAVKLNEIAERGNTGISDSVYTEVRNQAHDFVSGIRGQNYNRNLM